MVVSKNSLHLTVHSSPTVIYDLTSFIVIPFSMMGTAHFASEELIDLANGYNSAILRAQNERKVSTYVLILRSVALSLRYERKRSTYNVLSYMFALCCALNEKHDKS